jgi:putative autoinducer-2 (AI-2) aldolase
VKTYWCENFEKVAEGCPVPVVMAGGPKCETAREVFEFVYDGMQRGAIGINLGRNVWQSEHPPAVACALRAIIHEGADVDQADAIYNEMK